MIACGSDTFTYNSQNQLLTAGGHTYTYDAEGSRLSNVTATTDIKYVYDTNAELSRMLVKNENGTVTKYVYGHGLIGEESGGTFKTYHYDYRGSTVAITNASGTVTDTFAYDTYGALTARTGSTPIIFGYNGRDGVVTDANGLLYMRARYYSPDLRRFINADVLVGSMDDSATLNRYAYANGNPVMNVDPLGLMVTRDGGISYVPQTPRERKLWADEQKTWKSWRRVNTHTPNSAERGTSVKEILEYIGEWLDKYARNEDGTYSFYDNQRSRFKKSVFHEQVLAFTPSKPSLNLKEGNIGVGSLSIDALTGGWEGEYANLSLFDFGHAEVSFGMSDYHISVGAFVSAWSPSFSVNIFGATLEIGAEVGAVGKMLEFGKHGFKIKSADIIGITIGLTW